MSRCSEGRSRSWRSLNARRLRLPLGAQAAIAAAALVAEAVVIVLARSADIADSARIISAAAGVAAYGVAFLIQRSADRVFAYHADEEAPYTSLFGAGAAAVIAARAIDVTIWWPT